MIEFQIVRKYLILETIRFEKNGKTAVVLKNIQNCIPMPRNSSLVAFFNFLMLIYLFNMFSNHSYYFLIEDLRQSKNIIFVFSLFFLLYFRLIIYEVGYLKMSPYGWLRMIWINTLTNFYVLANHLLFYYLVYFSFISEDEIDGLSLLHLNSLSIEELISTNTDDNVINKSIVGLEKTLKKMAM